MDNIESPRMLKHLIEVRKRLIRILALFLSLFCVLFYYSETLFAWVVSPLLQVLPASKSLIATHVASPLLVPIKLAFHSALILIVPYGLFELWSFISPALYPREKKTFVWLLPAGVVLFILGLLFSYVIVLPFLFSFFQRAAPDAVWYLPDISLSVNFIGRMLLIFGLSFELPLVCLGLNLGGVLSVNQFTRFRPYFIVIAFVVGMILTPPDVLSQVLLALPLCLLYELGILLIRVFGREKKESLTLSSKD